MDIFAGEQLPDTQGNFLVIPIDPIPVNLTRNSQMNVKNSTVGGSKTRTREPSSIPDPAVSTKSLNVHGSESKKKSSNDEEIEILDKILSPIHQSPEHSLSDSESLSKSGSYSRRPEKDGIFSTARDLGISESTWQKDQKRVQRKKSLMQKARKTTRDVVKDTFGGLPKGKMRIDDTNFNAKEYLNQKMNGGAEIDTSAYPQELLNFIESKKQEEDEFYNEIIKNQQSFVKQSSTQLKKFNIEPAEHFKKA